MASYFVLSTFLSLLKLSGFFVFLYLPLLINPLLAFHPYLFKSLLAMKGQLTFKTRRLLLDLMAAFVNFGHCLKLLVLLFEFKIMKLFYILALLSNVPIKVIAVSLPL